MLLNFSISMKFKIYIDIHSNTHAFYPAIYGACKLHSANAKYFKTFDIHLLGGRQTLEKRIC